ncbi:MAG: hypothetical protein A4E66_01345 [Syntrophus sp. PtaB.Bin001]|nr:MAG: hypothetical protein A4E66_01345 [Syntrophus sp. PtaB.Bin001]
MVKKYAWRSVQLTDNNAFRSINNESPLFGHQRNFTKINLLLFYVSDGFLIRQTVRVKNYESYHNFQGSRIGHTLLNALVYIITNISYFITNEFQGALSTEIRNRKYAFKSTLQTVILTIFWSFFLLKKRFVRSDLNVNQIGNFQNFFDTAEVFSKFAHGIPNYLLGPQTGPCYLII